MDMFLSLSESFSCVIGPRLRHRLPISVTEGYAEGEIEHGGYLANLRGASTKSQ